MVAEVEAAETLEGLVAKIIRRVAADGGFNGSTQATGLDGLQHYDAKAVGAILGVDDHEVYRMARVGEIGCIKKGRAVWFLRAHIEEWQGKHSVAARR